LNETIDKGDQSENISDDSISENELENLLDNPQ